MSFQDKMKRVKEFGDVVGARAKEGYETSKARHIDTETTKLNQQTSMLLDKHGLDIEQSSNDDIKQLNAKNIQKIHSDLVGNGITKVALTLGGNSIERAKLGYLSALVEQNWVLMRQNELIIRELGDRSK